MSVDNLVGQSLGQYQLKELLGAGGMGAVYRAIQVNLKRDVAVKVLLAGLAQQPDFIKRFNLEAEFAARLEHPNIVPIYDYGTERDISYIVMRYLEKRSLARRLQPREDGPHVRPSIGEAVILLRQLASALDYAHSQKVVHRDIKPGNVMFDNRGTAYLVDFGIAKLMDGSSNLTATGMMVGTPSYMAPELWRGDQANPSTDQYALAAMVYDMLSGRLPFEAPTPFALMHKHMNEMPTPLQLLRSDVPAALTPVLERALAKEGRDRFPTATLFAQAFESAAEGAKGEPTGLFTTPVPPSVPRLAPRAAPLPVAVAKTPLTVTPQPILPQQMPPASAPTLTPRRTSLLLLWVLLGVIAVLVIALAVLLFNPFGGQGDQPTSVAVLASGTPPPTQPAETALVDAPTAVLPATTVGQVALVQSATIPPSPAPADTATTLPNDTPVPTNPLLIAVVTATETSSPTEAPTTAVTPSPGPTATQSLVVLLMPTGSAAPTEAATATGESSSTPTSTEMPSAAPTEESGFVLLPTDTPTLVPSVTATEPPPPTLTPTDTPQPTLTSTDLPTATDTPTEVPTLTATNTPLPTSTSTEAPTPVPTETPTEALSPVFTPTVVPGAPMLIPAGSAITLLGAPDTSSSPIGQITDGQPRLVVGASLNFYFFLIQDGPQLAWIVAKGDFGYTGNLGLVPAVPSAPPFVNAGAEPLTVYAEPQSGSDALGQVSDQQLLITGLSEQKDFWRVNYYGAVGWIGADAPTGGSLDNLAIVPSGAPRLDVGTTGIAVYRQPGSDPSEMIGTAISTSLPITGISSDNEFFRVEFAGQQGWVSSRAPDSQPHGDLTVLPTAPPPATATPQPSPTVIQIIAATATLPPTASATATPASTGVTVSNYNNVNVRSGDSTAFPVIARLLAGEVAEVLGVSSNGTGWYQIRLPSGDTGWVGGNVVQASGDTSNLPTITPPQPGSGQSSGGQTGTTRPRTNTGGVNCNRFRGTSPLGSVRIGSENFYWDPAPGATSYRIIASNQSGKVRMILEATSTTVSANTSSWAGDTSINWLVQALLNGQVVCTTATISIPTSG